MLRWFYHVYQDSYLIKEILLNNKCLPITSLVEIYNDSSLQKLYCRNSILLPWTSKRHKSIWIWIQKVSTWERLNKGLWFYDIISSWSTMMKNWKHNLYWSNWFYVILSSLWSCDHPLPVYIYMYRYFFVNVERRFMFMILFKMDVWCSFS